MGGKLKLLPDTHCNARKIVNDAKQTGNLLHNNWWYLHGHLSDIVGYDKASIINAKDCTEFVKELPEFMKLSYNGESWEGAVQTINLIPHAYINGVVECEVIGVSEPCVGYFWTTNEEPLRIIAENGEVFTSIHWDQRGLVCLKSDIEACADALEKYTKKSRHL